MWAYATQVEVLRRLRKAASNLFAATHVNANDGGQAVIGNVKKEDANNPSQILTTNNNLLCVERRGLNYRKSTRTRQAVTGGLHLAQLVSARSAI